LIFIGQRAFYILGGLAITVMTINKEGDENNE
jgi:hypothetical protein